MSIQLLTHPPLTINVPTTDMIQLDAKRIVKRFGGRIELWRRLAAHGHHISVKTIEKWMERNSIPSSRLLILIDLAKAEKSPLDLDEYTIKSK